MSKRMPVRISERSHSAPADTVSRDLRLVRTEANAPGWYLARQVGYANAFALTVAFTRVRGTTPRQHRTRAL